MTFDQYISHPADQKGGEPILLADHLRAVSQVMQSELPDDATTAGGGRFQTLARITGLTHDIAKATTWAQQHLRGLPLDADDRYRYHGFPSALVTLYCGEQHDELDRRDVGLAALVVAQHHSRSAPPDPTHSRQRYTADKPAVNERYRRVERQFGDIYQHTAAASVVSRMIDEAVGPDYSASWDDFIDWYDREAVMKLLVDALGDGTVDERYYTDLARLWSTLKYADQLAASLGRDLTAHLDNELAGSVWTTLQNSEQVPMRDAAAQSRLTVDRLEQFIATELPEETGIKRQLNDLRTRARTQALKRVQALVETDDAVGLISLPTGFGKTFAGLAAGLRARDLTGGRLVYTLPYTSILDQTAADIERVFDVEVTDPSFTLHHHLSTTLSDLGDRYTDADIGRSVGALHAESWQSALTLTTTVQLFESLAAPTGRQATKLPALQDSVVVLDEPQAIPERWWQLVVELLEMLVIEYDATVILMTATQPQLIRHGASQLTPTKLVGDSSDYVDFLAEHPRVEYVIDESVHSEERPIEYDTAAARLTETTTSGADTLAICNTRASAQALHTHTEAELSTTAGQSPVRIGVVLNRHIEQTGCTPSVDELRHLVLDAATAAETTTRPILAYLSGDIRPTDRQLIINALYDEETDTDPLLDTAHPIVLVSTSVVEAGVDISFDRVYRDIAPIPNIVQSGGRCNRSFDGELGRVTVWTLAPPPARTQLPSHAIHGSDGAKNLPLLHATTAALDVERGQTISEEQMIGEIVDRFYDHINTRYDPGSKKLAEHVQNCRVDELADARMIQEIEDYEDIVVCSTAAERRAGGMDGSGTIAEGTLLDRVGTHVSARPPAQATTIDVGNSEYYLVDAQSDHYDSVFGLVDHST